MYYIIINKLPQQVVKDSYINLKYYFSNTVVIICSRNYFCKVAPFHAWAEC